MRDELLQRGDRPVAATSARRSARVLQAGVGALGVLLLSCACGYGAPAAVHGSSSQAGSVAAPAGRPPDPLAPSTYRPVIRHGAPPHPTIAAPAAGFSATSPARFSDGVTISVDRVAHAVEVGEGPGVFPGRPHTVISLSLTNGSPAPIDLTQVVVTTTYGAPARIASPVYEDPAAVDFAGTVAPGGTSTATYVFAVPVGQTANVVTRVDFDDVHVAARFAGRVQ